MAADERGPFSLYDWLEHCPSCGQPIAGGDHPHQLFCWACGFKWYLNAAAAVAGLLYDAEGRLLLTRRAKEPAKGKLDAPGGFSDPGESAEETLVREVREELGLALNPTQFRYLTSWPNRYLYAGVAYPVMDLVFAAEIPADATLELEASEISGAEWHDGRRIDVAEVSFPSIRRAIALWRFERWNEAG